MFAQRGSYLNRLYTCRAKMPTEPLHRPAKSVDPLRDLDFDDDWEEYEIRSPARKQQAAKAREDAIDHFDTQVDGLQEPGSPQRKATHDTWNQTAAHGHKTDLGWNKGFGSVGYRTEEEVRQQAKRR